MPTIIRKIAIALLLGLDGVLKASGGQYYDLALKAFDSGDYERCIEIFEKKLPAEIKQEKKARTYNNYNWWPYIESAVAMKDFKRAFHGITDNNRIINKKYWIDDRWWNLTPRDLELWPEEKKPLLDVVLEKFFLAYNDDVAAFRASPLVRHIAGTGRYTVDNMVAQAAEFYFRNSLEALKYRSDATFYHLRRSADFGHAEALGIVAEALEKGYISVDGGDNLPVARNMKEASAYLRQLMEVTPDDAYPYYMCGQLLLYGDETVRDPAAAIGCFDKAIERIQEKNLHKSAAYKKRALCYMEMGDTVGFFNKNKEALEAGVNSVAHNLGNCYKNGWGTPVDFRKAFEAYSAGLERQDALSPVVPCQWEVALLLRDSKGCTADPERALELFKAASDAGLIFAQYTLAEEYYNRQQWSDAMTLCQTVAEREDRIPDAARASVCKKIASMYTHGRGVESDEAAAKLWWDRAASYGDDDAGLISRWLGQKQ